MNVTMILLRIIHIFAGVFWAGTTFFFVSFLEPTLTATAPESNKVMGYLTQRTRYVTTLGITAPLVALTGLIMYWRVFGWLALNSAAGWGFTLGGLAGLAAVLVGLFMARPATLKMGAVAKQIQAAGGPPSPEQMAQMKALGERLSSAARLTAILLTLALLGMSAARYLG